MSKSRTVTLQATKMYLLLKVYHEQYFQHYSHSNSSTHFVVLFNMYMCQNTALHKKNKCLHFHFQINILNNYNSKHFT